MKGESLFAISLAWFSFGISSSTLGEVIGDIRYAPQMFESIATVQFQGPAARQAYYAVKASPVKDYRAGNLHVVASHDLTCISDVSARQKLFQCQLIIDLETGSVYPDDIVAALPVIGIGNQSTDD